MTSALLLLGVTACSGDDNAAGSTDANAKDSPNAAMQEACDRLSELGQAILDARQAQSRDEVRAGVSPTLAAFEDAAAATDDDRLHKLAEEAQAQFEVYLTADDPIDSREAGNASDIALDRAVKRCAEHGVTTVFPEEPRLRSDSDA